MNGVGACSTQVDMIHTEFSSGNLQEEDTQADLCVNGRTVLTLRLLMSYIYGAPSKARNANVVYIWIYVWQR